MGDSGIDRENEAVLKLVNLVLMDAMKKSASRIAFGTGPDPASVLTVTADGMAEPRPGPTRARKVWFELDGHACPVMIPPNLVFDLMIGRVLDMAEIADGPRISPTRGRIHIVMSGNRHFFFDVAAFPQGGDPAVVIILRGATPPESIPKLDAFRFSYPLSA